MENKKYSWYPSNGSCPDVFDSIEEAIKDAQHRYDEEYEEFEDREEVSHIISVGPVRHFNLKGAVENIVEDIDDNIGDQLYDFVTGCDFEPECYISKKDKEAFKKEAMSALLPIVEKFLFTNPQWLCACTHKYDLKNRKFIEDN